MAIDSHRLLATLAAATLLAPFLGPNGASAQTVSEGDCVCYEGFIMDRFCINRGTLFDNRSVVTLKNPELHSVHCLVDVPQCINSGYTVLADPMMSDDLYTVAAQFDSNGSNLLRELGIASGVNGFCTECTGELDQLTQGFRATVVGLVTDVGDATSTNPLDRAPTVEVLEVAESSTGCAEFTCPEPPPPPPTPPSATPPSETPPSDAPPSEGDCVCHEGFIMDRFCINRKTLFDNPSVVTLEDPAVHSMHCLLDVAQCINSGYTVLADPMMTGDAYTVAYQFDAEGDRLMTELGKASGAAGGSCTSCTGEIDQLTNAFRATVIGRIDALGDPESDNPIKQAASLAVTEVLPSSVGCAEFTCPEVETGNPTTPPEGGTPEEEVDCNDYVTEVTLNESPRVTLSFTVNVPGTDTNVEFSPEEEAAGGSFRARLTYEGEGWVAFGRSPDGRMAGSETVICLPDDGDVSKYDLTQQSQAGVTPMPDDSQTLIDTSISQEGSTTVCEFTKLLVEDDELPLEAGSGANIENTFVWAIGGANPLAYHLRRASAPIPLQACTSSFASENVDFDGGSQQTYESYWKAHGIMMALAWGFCAPVAIAAALARSIIPGDGLWFKIHQSMNTLCCILTIAGFGVAVAAYNKAGTPHFNATHQQVGLAVFVIVLLQVLNGATRPHLPAKAPPQDVEEQAEQPTPEKSKTRTGWEIGHKLAGVALLAMGMYNIYTGPQLYAVRFPSVNANAWTTAQWAWLGVLLGAAVIVKILSVVRKK